MKNVSSRRKLVIQMETLRSLQAQELEAVAGGSYSTLLAATVLCRPTSEYCSNTCVAVNRSIIILPR